MLLPTIFILSCLFAIIPVSLTDTQCTNTGGTCQDWRYYKCTAGYETGLCNGDTNRRCCLNCDATCESTDNSYNDQSCENQGGVCQVNSNYCTGTYASGYCGGPTERQCCLSNSGGGSCPLMAYLTSYIKGYNNAVVEVESGFVGHMDTLSSYAKSCGVTVWVTHSFRQEGQNLDGTVVAPSTTSNHLVGHAIDFNLATPSGWCNSACLQGGYNNDAQCFIQKVLNDGNLRWGGVWSTPDPVHIDDGLNVYNKGQWDALYYNLQAVC